MANGERRVGAGTADGLRLILGLRMYTIAHILPSSGTCPNFTILNSLFTIPVFNPPLLSPLLSTRLPNQVEAKVEVEV